jgi:hypothetical protein
MISLQEILDNVRQGQTILSTYKDYINKTKDDINDLMEEIDDGDTVRRIRNTWEQMSACPLLLKPDAKFDPQEQLHYLEMLNEQIDRIIFLVGALTIPTRLNDWLHKARPGYYIPFHLVFEDEIPDSNDRQKVLNYLAWSPEVIRGGIVDAANGLIYRYDKDPKARRNSIIFLFAGLIFATLIVAGAALVPAEGWPLSSEDIPTLLIGWGAVLIGIVVHLGVGSVKRQRMQGGLPPVISIGDLPLILNARTGQLLLKLLLALIGLFGLVFTTGIDNTSVLNSFLVGYSLDSFVELFGANLEQQASAQINMLKSSPG